jgi:hypothetical protein
LQLIQPAMPRFPSAKPFSPTMEILREVKTAKSGQLAPLHIPPANTVRERPT